jgi:hypothetical protein
MSSVTSAPNWRVRYDRCSDVLYVSKRPEAPARSREEEPGVVWRYDAERGDLIGVTIIDFAAYWGRRRPELIDLIASRFALSRQGAEEIVERAGR